MTQSVLMYEELPLPAGPKRATLLALHGQGGDLEQLKPLGGLVGASLEVLVLEAKRPVSPHASHRGAEDYRGYTWYLIQEVGYPEPASFGDSLQQVEQFVYDVLERAGGAEAPLYLLGYDQGAVLALAAAVLLPEYVRGVVGICGYLPEIPGWSLPVEDMRETPVLLVRDPREQMIPAVLMEKTVDELKRRGARTELMEVAGAWQDPLVVAGVLQEWLSIELAKQSSEALCG